MKFELVHYFDGPRDRVAHWLMEAEEPLLDPAELPNVTQMEEIFRNVTGPIRKIKWKFCAHSDIPRALQNLIKPEMLTWIHHGEYNSQIKEDSFMIEPFYLKNIFSCKGGAKFFDEGQKTRRVIFGEVKLKVPIIGVIFEEIVVKKLKENMTEEYKVTSKKVAEKIAAEK